MCVRPWKDCIFDESVWEVWDSAGSEKGTLMLQLCKIIQASYLSDL